MIRTTPFHERTAALNETGLWEHWSNHLAADALPDVREVRVLRDPQRAGLFDSSPLYKYRIHGPDAERFLAGVLPATSGPASRATPSTRSGATTAASSSRTASSCATRPDEFLLTAAEPNLAYFEELIGRLDVGIEDVSDDWAVLAVQGPRSRDLLALARAAASPSCPTSGYLRRRSPRSRSTSRGPATPATSATRSGSGARDALARLGRGLGGRAAAGASSRSG